MALSTRLRKLSVRFEQMSENDRRALLVLSAFLIACFAYMALAQSYRFRSESINHFTDVRSDSAWMYSNIKTARRLMSTTDKKEYKGNGDSLITVASTTAKDFSLTLKRFQPDGDNGLRLSLESANFNQMILWLNKLEKEYGVNVKHIAVEKASKHGGMVDVSLSLVRL